MSRLAGVDSKKSFFTAVFRVCDGLYHPHDDDDYVPVDLKKVHEEKQSGTYIYIITEDERLIATQYNAMHPDAFDDTVPFLQQTHGQLAKKENGVIRMGGQVESVNGEFVIDNGSGHFKPFFDDNAAHYTLSIFELNGIQNAKFECHFQAPNNGHPVKLPDNFVKYAPSKLSAIPHPASSDSQSFILSSLIPAIFSGQLHGAASSETRTQTTRSVQLSPTYSAFIQRGIEAVKTFERADTSLIKTPVFKLRDDIHGPKDWIPAALVDPKQIASKKQDACTIDDTYLYIITEDEKLLITRNNTLDVMLEGGVNRVTHAQIAKHATNGLVRAAGMIFWDASACKWVANNKSGHFTPFLDDNTAHYTLSILEKNGINNARFDAIPESILPGKKILPKNCIGYKESAVLSTRLQDSLLEYEQKLGQAVKGMPSTAELKSAYSTAQRARYVDVTSAAASTTHHAQQEALRMRAIETTNAQTTLLNQTQLAELRKAKAAHEAYKSRGENANSQEAWHFMSSTASVLNVCASGLSANRDFAPVARTFSRAANTISGVVAAKAAGEAVKRWAGSAALGTATAGIGFALTAFSTLVSFFSGDDDSGSGLASALAGMEDRIRGDISEFRSEFKDYRKEFRVAIQVLQQDIRTVGMMVSQVLVELRGVANLCAQTLQSLLQLELFIREQAAITNAQLQSIQTHPLELARLTLEKYITGKGSAPTREELRSSLTQIELWITIKLHQPAITDAICARLSSERVTSLLAERSGNSLLGLVAARLRLHFGDAVPAEFSTLPPMDLFLSLSQLYFSAVEKSLAPSGDAYASVCEKIKSTVNLYLKFITFLKMNSQLTQALFDQVDYQLARNAVMAQELRALLKNIVPLLGNEKCTQKLALLEKSTAQSVVPMNVNADIWDNLPTQPNDRIKKLFGLLSQDNPPTAARTKYMLLPEGAAYTPIPSSISWASYAAPDGSSTSYWGCSYFPNQPKPPAFVSVSVLFLLLASGYADMNFFRNSTLKKQVTQLIASCPSSTYSRLVYEGGWDRIGSSGSFQTMAGSPYDGVHGYPHNGGFMIQCGHPPHYEFFRSDEVRSYPAKYENNYVANSSVYSGHRANIFEYHAKLTDELPKDYEAILKHNAQADIDTYKILFKYYVLYSQGKLKEADAFIRKQTFAQEYEKSYFLFMVAILGRWDIFEAFNKIHPIANYNWAFRDTAITPLMLAEQHGHDDVAAGLSKKLTVSLCRTTETEKLLQSQLTLVQYYQTEFAQSIPKSESDAQAASQQSEEALYQRGFEYGNAMALTVISAALHQAGFSDAAVLLQRDQPNALSFQNQNELAPAEKRGFLQAISSKVINAISQLAKGQKSNAIAWLSTFSDEQITRSLESLRATKAIANGVASNSSGFFALSGSSAASAVASALRM